MKKKHYISVISSACGIRPPTLRMWERRYGVFQPDRDAQGQRLYSDEDLTRAILIAKLLESNYTISSVANLSLEELQELHSKIQQHQVQNISQLNNVKLSLILEHLATYQLDKVAAELQHARLTTGAREYILGLVLPVIREIGNLVAKGKYSVTQEHIISTLLRDQLAQIYLPNLGQGRPKIALATPEGSLHEFSILIADILCRGHRLSTSYLGPAHPALCLAQALNVLSPELLILGVVSSDQWDYQNKIIPYLNQLDKNLSYKLTIILGGGYPLDFPEFQKIKKIQIFKSFDEFDKHLELLA